MTQTCSITLPPHFSNVTIGGKKFEFWALQGTGLAENVWSETNISSSRNGRGDIAAIHSSSTTRREFWVRLQDGKEKQISLPDNVAFAVREGHQLSLICMKSDCLSNDSFYYMGVVNHTTDSYVILDNNWMFKRFAGTDHWLIQRLAGVLVVFTLGLGLIVLEIYSRSIAAQYIKPIQKQVDSVASFLFKQGFQVG